MAGKIGNSSIDRHRARAAEFKRTMGMEGQGSPGDITDRFRGAYKPGARKAPKVGFYNPVEAIKEIGGMFKKKKPTQ